MEDYKKLVERTLNDLRRSEKYCLNDYSHMAGNAANLIESLLDKLKYAEGERDVLTKRMIELKEQNAALRKQADELTKAGLTATDRANKAIAELHETRSELDAAVRGQETLQNALEEVKAELAAAIKALDEALIMDNRECFDGENFPCGYRQWCDLCDENEERGCAKAYLEWLSSQKEA